MLKSVIVEVTGLRKATRSTYANGKQRTEEYIKISCALDEGGIELDLTMDDDKIAGSGKLKIGDTILVMLALTPEDKNLLFLKEKEIEEGLAQ